MAHNVPRRVHGATCLGGSRPGERCAIWALRAGNPQRGNTCIGGEVMAHGNLGDRPSGGGSTRWWRLGILTLARVAGPRVQRGRRRRKPEAEAGRPLAEVLEL